MGKWIAIKLINFGLWIYDTNKDEKWDKTDQEMYEKLSEYVRELETH